MKVFNFGTAHSHQHESTDNAGDPKGFGENNSEITHGGQTVKPGGLH